MTTFDRKLSHTSLASFRRCKMRYKWSYINNYDPLPSRGQMVGSVGHAALGMWYKMLADGADPNDAEAESINSASEKLMEYEEQHGYEMPDIWDDTSVVLLRYYDWALKNDDFKLAYTGDVPMVEYEFELKVGEFTLIGYIDGIVERNNGTLWVLEHKFNKTVQTGHLDLDPQVSIYMMAARALGLDVRGALYNVVRTTIKGKAENEPVVRLPVYRNNEGLEQIIRELVVQMEDMKAFHEDGGIRAYRTPTRDCSWDCGFYGACLAINDDGNPEPALQLIPMKEHKSSETDSSEGE